MLCFLESLLWLSLLLRQDTYKYTLNFNDLGVADGSNWSGLEPGAGFRPVADLYKKGPEFGLLIHCTTITWDA